MSHEITSITAIDEEIETYLSRIGQIFTAFRQQDSLCISYGVRIGPARYFVKHTTHPPALEWLRQAAAISRALDHPALLRLHNSFTTPGGGLALVYDWSDGEVLYDYTHHRGERLTNPSSAFYRFRQLPVERVLAVLDTIYDLHLRLAGLGYIAVDFYDGCILYDFSTHTTHICDLDMYRDGPFILDADRLPGGRRFMAPEEFQRGALIDQVTNVFMLGRTAFELLCAGSSDPADWPAGPVRYQAALKAISPEREKRYGSVREFVEAWQASN